MQETDRQMQNLFVVLFSLQIFFADQLALFVCEESNGLGPIGNNQNFPADMSANEWMKMGNRKDQILLGVCKSLVAFFKNKKKTF